jgi:hypothetical protein
LHRGAQEVTKALEDALDLLHLRIANTDVSYYCSLSGSMSGFHVPIATDYLLPSELRNAVSRGASRSASIITIVTAVATAVLAVGAIAATVLFAYLAFRAQSREVANQTEQLKLQRRQFEQEQEDRRGA